MFTFADRCIVRWPVEIAVPADDGTTAPAEIRVSYRLPLQHETLAYLRAIDALAARETAGERIAVEFVSIDDDRLRTHVVDWSEIVDDTGAPVPFSAAALDAALDVPWVRTALLAGLRAAAAGALEKN